MIDFIQVGTVAVLFFVAGMIVSMLSGYLQCSKWNFSESAKQGGIYMVAPTLVFSVLQYFSNLKNPFIRVFSSYGIQDDWISIGYILMCTVWPFAVWNIHSSEKSICIPSVDEMTAFKQTLLKELQQKEQEKQSNEKKQ